MTFERDDPPNPDIHRGVALGGARRVTLPAPPIIQRRLCQQHFKPN
jgi:hypothetical protein